MREGIYHEFTLYSVYVKNCNLYFEYVGTTNGILPLT